MSASCQHAASRTVEQVTPSRSAADSLPSIAAAAAGDYTVVVIGQVQLPQLMSC